MAAMAKRVHLFHPVIWANALDDGRPVKKYLIVDHYNGKDSLIGSVWAKNVREALRIWRLESQDS
jgi:hypothetical protein